jgi:hypothetical protein
VADIHAAGSADIIKLIDGFYIGIFQVFMKL